MLEQQCPKCGSDYDYFEKTATVICQNNHIICRLCAIQVSRNSGLCPECYNPIFNLNQDAYRQQIAEINKNPYWQSNQGQGFQNNTYPINQNQNQGFGPQPRALPLKKQHSGIFCALSILFLIIFFILLIVRIGMDDFSSAMPEVMFGLFISFFLCISFFSRFMAIRRRNEMIQQGFRGQGDYRRI